MNDDYIIIPSSSGDEPILIVHEEEDDQSPEVYTISDSPDNIITVYPSELKELGEALIILSKNHDGTNIEEPAPVRHLKVVR